MQDTIDCNKINKIREERISDPIGQKPELGEEIRRKIHAPKSNQYSQSQRKKANWGTLSYDQH